MSSRVTIRQFTNKKGSFVAPFTPEHAIYDTSGKRLDIKIAGLDLDRISSALTHSEEAISAQTAESVKKIIDEQAEDRERLDALNKTIAQLSGQTSIFDESGNPLSENPVHVISNEEFVIATVDAEDKLLYGIRKDGSVYQCAIDDLTQTKINELSNTLNNEFSTKLQELSDKIDRNWVGVEYIEEEGQINAILGDDSKIKEVTVDEDGNIVFTQLIN